MEWFGKSHKSFHFEMFSASHLVTLAIFFFVSSAIFLFRKKLNGDGWRRLEVESAISLIFAEILNHVWMLVNEVWKLGRSMPLELCNIGLILCILLLLTRKKYIFELLIFIAILGATQAILTPALTYDFPHFRFFHFFYAHMMVVWVALYFLWARKYYPSFRSVIKLIVFINLLLPAILLINNQTKGNYWFLRHKPKTPSFFDILGDYPWYIFTLESLLIILSLITWFIFRKWEKGHKERSHF
ncbi:TIGR02206 family membrane protein [Bacillus sp. NTK034]|uniref:YwaF family protein n=1 Tax=Bacillus sp. NTK034 TaxID=2802176 RepID=UPI001A8EDC92|nr:TIGR02206 family membrane protein [Bacillus sp. NTK034]MBN8200988.1 TIGR02206 family membrane protein [Bacillus sp. NTK034]